MILVRSKFVLAFVCACLPGVLSWGHFRERIPNGQNVKNPFYTASNGQEQKWRGVGHWSAQGGDERNPFGLAFLANNKVSRIFVFAVGYLIPYTCRQ